MDPEKPRRTQKDPEEPRRTQKDQVSKDSSFSTFKFFKLVLYVLVLWWRLSVHKDHHDVPSLVSISPCIAARLPCVLECGRCAAAAWGLRSLTSQHWSRRSETRPGIHTPVRHGHRHLDPRYYTLKIFMTWYSYTETLVNNLSIICECTKPEQCLY